jgi:hypothetical protein
MASAQFPSKFRYGLTCIIFSSCAAHSLPVGHQTGACQRHWKYTFSRIRDSFGIARNTAFTYKGKNVDAKEIGKELGVRYVLEGSVQREQKRVRVNAQLIDAGSGAHLLPR